VTEGVLIDDPQQAQARLEALHALGVRIALDDFGTGLSYLQRFPFDRVKIDRTFVASLGTSGNSGAIIQSIVTLGHALGMKVLGGGGRDRRAAGASGRIERIDSEQLFENVKENTCVGPSLGPFSCLICCG
jgi:predicted signal transduction protein with EAL and GGDEF domain